MSILNTWRFIVSVYRSKNIVSHYNNIGTMVRYSDYSLSEINDMIPYEFEIYSAILTKQLKEEKAKNGK